ncbi:hypothetical protein ACVWXO_004421 [Bradyrhizobium sp. LM2.7]
MFDLVMVSSSPWNSDPLRISPFFIGRSQRLAQGIGKEMFGMMRRYDADCGNDAPHEDQTAKRSYFSEEQIIGILNEHEADVSVADLPQAWRQRRQHLQMKSEVRRDGGVGGQAAEDA